MCEECKKQYRRIQWEEQIGLLPQWTDEELNEIIMECQKLKRERRIEKFRQFEERTPAWRNG